MEEEHTAFHHRSGVCSGENDRVSCSQVQSLQKCCQQEVKVKRFRN